MNLQQLSTFLVLLLMQIHRNASEETSTCGQRSLRPIPILSHTDRTTKRYPWHAAIYHQIGYSSSIYRCGGTLISSRSVLVTAHCVSMVKAEQVSVSLGKFNLDAFESSSQFMEVAEIIRHSNFSSESESYENDIAIIKLATKATFNNYVQPICLWNANRTNLEEVIGKSGTVIGWGKQMRRERKNKIREAYLPVVPSLTCLRSNPDLYGKFLSDTNYCAGTGNDTSVCRNDSGGSMAFEENGIYYIRGIMSIRATKVNREKQELECDPSQYTIFTDVAQFLPWIEQNVAL